MIRSMRVLIIVSVLAAASNASAACRWLGTQLDCDLGASSVVIGTQATEKPTYRRSFWPRFPFELELQDVGADASLCRDIRNETYCD